MRVLLTADPYLPVPPLHYGGIERIVAGLIAGLRVHGHEVGLLAHEDSHAPNDFFRAWPRSAPRGALAHIANTRMLHEAVRSFRPDVLHSFSRLAYMAALLPRRLPKIMSYQRATGGRNIAVAAKLAGASLRFTGCSEFIAAMGRRAGGHWDAIPNFVELEKFSFRPVADAGAPLVFLSRVERIKGAHTAIEVARRCGAPLLIAGNIGSTARDRRYWEEEIQPRLSDRIRYVGTVDDTAKAELLGRARAMIVPIEWDEPFGIVFAEALACGTPVVSCPRGALPEIVRDGVEGFLVEGVEAACAAVSRLGEIDRSACRQRAEQHFSAAVVVSRYESLYREMAGASP